MNLLLQSPQGLQVQLSHSQSKLSLQEDEMRGTVSSLNLKSEAVVQLEQVLLPVVAVTTCGLYCSIDHHHLMLTFRQAAVVVCSTRVAFCLL
jgi:hypothetical protein